MEIENVVEFLPIKLMITSELVNLYATMSGDRNQLHLDDAFACTTRFGCRIAHGMLSIAAVIEMLERAFGLDWSMSGHLEVSLIAPVPLGSTLCTGGRVTSVNLDRQGYRFGIEAWATIDDGHKALTATGSIFSKIN